MSFRTVLRDNTRKSCSDCGADLLSWPGAAAHVCKSKEVPAYDGPIGLTEAEKAPALAKYRAGIKTMMTEEYGAARDHTKACNYNFGGSCNCPQRPPLLDPTNPKDLVGDTKVPMDLFPVAGAIYGAMAMKNGAAKFGPFNWRSSKVRFSVYLAAMERHLAALRDGEDDAPDSGLPHVAHLIANGAILADALEGGFLIDDRPPAGPGAATLEKFRVKP